MDSRPAYLLGRGRGRGQGRGRAQAQRSVSQDFPAVGQRESVTARSLSDQDDFKYKSATAKAGKGMYEHGLATAETRFQHASAKMKESVQKHLESMDTEDVYESSDEEDDLNDEGIMESMIKSFSGSSGLDTPELGSTQEYLISSFKSKANACLICIETVRRNDAIWSCRRCYCSFHINCIQKWVKDGVYQQSVFEEDNSKNKDIPWYCPKCRFEYHQTDCPTRYFCYCEKEEDPQFDPWLVPHSCGQTCARKLKPECGHSCLLLCHPGPCPPCPQTVRVSCHCGQQPAMTRRCGAKEWSCGRPCSQQLSCGHHSCKANCHPGECPPCPEKSSQQCLCGKNSSTRPCASPEWQCDQVCGKALACGNHTCERVCHSSDCGKCPRSGERSCPCGKTVFDLPCTEDVPTCGDTCGKLLECNLHGCTQRCHTGSCGTCLSMCEKSCRCGQKKKELPCYKEYFCETKCSKMKDCSRHQCKRKCCDGNCPSCEQPCGKTLSCRNHKCSSRCHPGRCYPCPLTISISCNCGANTVTVPCGRERVTKPPRCKKRCKKPSFCHHEEQTAHKCHFGDCPPCRQVCDKSLPTCEHRCPAKCHTAVKMKVQQKVQRAGPWEPKPEEKIETLEQPCPACKVPIPTSCLGEHETVDMACAEVRSYSCGRQCGRMLSCGNHFCQVECHKIQGATDERTAGTTCEKCEQPCTKPRPAGCTHSCLLPCHPHDCPSCAQMIRMRCHCQLVIQYVECEKWTQADSRARDRLKACQSKCPKIFPCGHQCTSLCHPGPCPNPQSCNEKAKVRCACKRRKRDFLCHEVQSGEAVLECDELCQEHKEKVKKLSDFEEKAKREEEQRKQEEELADFERKMKRRTRKPRKQKAVVEEKSFFSKYWKYLLVISVLVAVMAVLIYFLMNQKKDM